MRGRGACRDRCPAPTSTSKTLLGVPAGSPFGCLAVEFAQQARNAIGNRLLFRDIVDSAQLDPDIEQDLAALLALFHIQRAHDRLPAAVPVLPKQPVRIKPVPNSQRDRGIYSAYLFLRASSVRSRNRTASRSPA